MPFFEPIVSAIKKLFRQKGGTLSGPDLQILYRSIASSLPNGSIFLIDKHLRCLLADGEALQAAGFSAKDFTGKAINEVLPPDVTKLYQPHYKAALRGETFKVEHVSNNRCYVTHGVPVRSEKGQVEAVLIVSYDVTEQKSAERTMALLQAAVHSANDAVLITEADLEDPGPRIEYVNPAFTRMTGYQVEEIIGKTPRILQGKKTDQTLLKRLKRDLVQSHEFLGKTINYRKDGSEYAVEWRITPLKDAQDNIIKWVAVQRDVSERHKIAEALEKSEQRYKDFVANSSEGVYRLEIFPAIDIRLPPEEQIALVYRRSALAECNDAFAQMYGYKKAHEVLGQGIGMMLPQEDPGVQQYLQSIIDAGYRITDTESVEVDRNGNPVYFLNSLYGVIEDNHLVRVWGTQRDITARKVAEDALKEADRKKDEFLATLAHELRNPLAPIRNGLQILKLANDPAAQAKARQMMERQLSHMVHLIDDLLDVSRISSGKIELKKKDILLSTVIESALETSMPLITQKNHTFEVQIPDQNVWIHVDPTRFSQVISNIITNAAKYTLEGGNIKLLTTVESGMISIRIIDNGIGIPEGMLEPIFDIFTQIDISLNRSQGGLGIGLSLVKKLIEMHDGSIRAESAGRGKGSIFTIQVPYIDSASEDVSKPVAPQKVEMMHEEKRILVVDDNQDGAESLALLLGYLGYETQTAFSGEQALTQIKNFSPNLVFLDIGLPDIDGYEVAKRIRQDGTASTFLVALTGWGTDADKKTASQVGFDFHLTKPVDVMQVEGLLAKIFKAAGVSSGIGSESQQR